MLAADILQEYRRGTCLIAFVCFTGHFKGYKIETWTEKEGEQRAREMVSNASKAFVNKFVPFTVNYVRVRVINSAYRGPASDILSFKTPEGSQ